MTIDGVDRMGSGDLQAKFAGGSPDSQTFRAVDHRRIQPMQSVWRCTWDDGVPSCFLVLASTYLRSKRQHSMYRAGGNAVS
jgi:hypothetical protein